MLWLPETWESGRMEKLEPKFEQGIWLGGKTYTLNGAIACLSKRLQRGKHETPFVFVEFMEILGPKVYDLLAKRNPIRLMAGAEGRVHAKGSSRLHVATENLLATLHEALAIRSTLPTERNPMSVMVNQ